MNDRLKELKMGVDADIGRVSLEVGADHNTNPLNGNNYFHGMLILKLIHAVCFKAKLVSTRGPESKFMAEFFNDVDLVKVNIGIIRAASASLSDVNEQVMLHFQ